MYTPLFLCSLRCAAARIPLLYLPPLPFQLLCELEVLEVFADIFGLSLSFAGNEVSVSVFHFPCCFWLVPVCKGENAELRQPSSHWQLQSSPFLDLTTPQVVESAPQAFSSGPTRYSPLTEVLHPDSEPHVVMTPESKMLIWLYYLSYLDASSYLCLK